MEAAWGQVLINAYRTVLVAGYPTQYQDLAIGVGTI